MGPEPARPHGRAYYSYCYIYTYRYISIEMRFSRRGVFHKVTIQPLGS